MPVRADGGARSSTCHIRAVIDGRDLMIMPGLVDIHSHPSTEPFYRGIREEHGVPAMFMSGLYERSLAYRPASEGRRAGKEVAYCEMLLTGITTVADLSSNDPGWIDLAARRDPYARGAAPEAEHAPFGIVQDLDGRLLAADAERDERLGDRLFDGRSVGFHRLAV